MSGPRIASEYDGRQEHIRALALPAIEVFENKYPDKDYEVELVMPEFNSICPLTGLPDFATVVITYAPGKWCAEMKSLKLYFTAYRSVGVFQEHAANKILEDFVKAVVPRRARLEARFNSRGGIATVVRCAWEASKKRRR